MYKNCQKLVWTIDIYSRDLWSRQLTDIGFTLDAAVNLFVRSSQFEDFSIVKVKDMIVVVNTGFVHVLVVLVVAVVNADSLLTIVEKVIFIVFLQ